MIASIIGGEGKKRNVFVSAAVWHSVASPELNRVVAGKSAATSLQSDYVDQGPSAKIFVQLG